jgi:hypothetical protein
MPCIQALKYFLLTVTVPNLEAFITLTTLISSGVRVFRLVAFRRDNSSSFPILRLTPNLIVHSSFSGGRARLTVVQKQASSNVCELERQLCNYYYLSIVKDSMHLLHVRNSFDEHPQSFTVLCTFNPPSMKEILRSWSWEAEATLVSKHSSMCVISDSF